MELVPRQPVPLGCGVVYLGSGENSVVYCHVFGSQSLARLGFATGAAGRAQMEGSRDEARRKLKVLMGTCGKLRTCRSLCHFPNCKSGDNIGVQEGKISGLLCLTRSLCERSNYSVN